MLGKDEIRFFPNGNHMRDFPRSRKMRCKEALIKNFSKKGADYCSAFF